MAGYFIYDIDVLDPEGFAAYARTARAMMAERGGEIVLNSKRIETLEGGWSPTSLVVARLPTFQTAHDFYFSNDYQRMMRLRGTSARSRGVLVESDT